MAGRDRKEWILIALLIIATGLLIGLTVWDWVR